MSRKINKPTTEQDDRWADASKAAKVDRQSMGKGDEGNYFLLETDLEVGSQVLVCQQANPEAVAVFPHPIDAKNYVDDWGEIGYGYMLLKAVDGLKGGNSIKTLEERRKVVGE